MPRINKKTEEELRAFVTKLAPDMRDKCTLCNETLSHIIKQGEAKSGAGTFTVARMLAEEVNKGADKNSQVTARALHERVRQFIGEKRPKKKPKPKVILSNGSNKPTPIPIPGPLANLVREPVEVMQGPTTQALFTISTITEGAPTEEELIPEEVEPFEVPAHIINQPHMTAAVDAINADRKKRAVAVEKLAKRMDSALNLLTDFAPLYRDFKENGTPDEKLYATAIFRSGTLFMDCFILMGYDLSKVWKLYMNGLKKGRDERNGKDRNHQLSGYIE